ncbi:FAD/NAD(P)-binding protein [Myxococcaceae bacterium GXIMD 01537]
MKREQRGDLVIIGGGASGTLLAASLLRRARLPLRVLVVEKRGDVGRGLAYSTRSPSHLLNVPAVRMSALPDEPEHFLRWVRREAPDTGPGDFARRRAYGRYLKEVLREAREAAAPGVEWVEVVGEVTSATVEEGEVRLALAGGGRVTARQAVLALGNAPPADLRVEDGGLYASPRYRRTPWDVGGLSRVAPGEPVLVVGTGLTMVDAVLSLLEQGHEGPIHALSRHGMLPHPHRAGDVAVRPARVPAGALGLRALLRAVRQEAERARDEGGDWREVVDGLRPRSVTLWQGLSTAEQRRFLRHVRAFWDVHRHRMAPEVGEVLTRLQREGRLELHAGRVRSFRLEGEDVEVRYRPRGAGTEALLRVRHVINCTGPEGILTGSPLPRALLKEGLARGDALGISLSAAEDGALLDARGRPSEHLFTLGPPRRGELWETVAIPEIRLQAEVLAGRLLRDAEAARSEEVGAPPPI